jgi:hypothetical protein
MMDKNNVSQKTIHWFLIVLGFFAASLVYAWYFYNSIFLLLIGHHDPSGSIPMGIASGLSYALGGYGCMIIGWFLLHKEKPLKGFSILVLILSFILPVPLSKVFFQASFAYSSTYSKNRTTSHELLIEKAKRKIDVNNFFYSLFFGYIEQQQTVRDMNGLLQNLEEKMGMQAVPVFEELRKRSKSKDVNMAILHWMARLDKSKPVPILEDLIRNSKDKEERKSACGLYFELKKKEAFPLFIEMLNAENNFEMAHQLSYWVRVSVKENDEVQKEAAINSLRKYAYKFRNVFFFSRKERDGSDFLRWVSIHIAYLKPAELRKQKQWDEIVNEEWELLKNGNF